MMRRRMWAGVAVVAALALSACASSGSTGPVKLSSKALCENAGGKYVQGTCQPGTAKTAEEMCHGFGGFFAVTEDLCHITPK